MVEGMVKSAVTKEISRRDVGSEPGAHYGVATRIVEAPDGAAVVTLMPVPLPVSPGQVPLTSAQIQKRDGAAGGPYQVRIHANG